jgi:hypothetical protein
MTDNEPGLQRLLVHSVEQPPSAVTVPDVMRRARQQRLRLAAMGAAAAVLAAGVALPLALISANHDEVAKVTTRPSPSTSPTPTPSPQAVVDEPAARADGVVLAIDANNRLVRAWPGTSRAPQPVPTGALPGNPAGIATRSVGGWVVSFTSEPNPHPGAATQRLAYVSEAGSVEPFGPAFEPTEDITGLAVRWDGTVAVAVFHDSGRDARPAEIQLLGSGNDVARTWVADSPDVNEIDSLSWNQAGTTLSYIAGSQTGAGIGGDPSFLNVNKPGGTAPTSSPWPSRDECTPMAASYLGHDRFAVFAECGNSTFVYVDPLTGQPLGAPQNLGDASSCLGAGIHPADNNNDVLIGACRALYLVHNGRVTKLHEQLTDAAWPGHHPPAA